MESKSNVIQLHGFYLVETNEVVVPINDIKYLIGLDTEITVIFAVSDVDNHVVLAEKPKQFFCDMSNKEFYSIIDGEFINIKSIN